MKQILILPLLFLITGCMLVSSKNINESAINKADSIDKIQSNIKQQPPHNIDLSKCDAHSTQLSIFTKNDFSFKSFACHKDEEFFILEYLTNHHDNFFINKKLNSFWYDLIKVEAVSIYRPKNNSAPPLLIVLHGEDICCYPRPSGTWYDVNLYQITQDLNNTTKVMDVTNLLDKENSGFEGQNDVTEPVTFKFKDIATIKAWLEENY